MKKKPTPAETIITIGGVDVTITGRGRLTTWGTVTERDGTEIPITFDVADMPSKYRDQLPAPSEWFSS